MEKSRQPFSQLDGLSRDALRVLDEPAVFSFESSLRSIARVQLSEDARHMIFHCAFGEEECAGDFSIAGALRNQAKYLELAFGEWVNR